MPIFIITSAIASSWPVRKALLAEKLGNSAKMAAKIAVELSDLVADNQSERRYLCQASRPTIFMRCEAKHRSPRRSVGCILPLDFWRE